MTYFNRTKVIEDLERDLGDLSQPDNRRRVAEWIADLQLEQLRVKGLQATLLAALRARDVVAREGAGRTLAPPARLIELRARDAITVEGGVYPIAWDGAIAYRWTGPGAESVLRVWLDRSVPVVFEIALHSFGDPRNEDALELRVDGAPVALQAAGDKLLRSDGFPIVEGSLFTEIAIRTPWMSTEPTQATSKRSRARQTGKRGQADVERKTQSNAGDRGFAFTHLRFFSEG
jgi:hypothetical protein